MGNGNAVQNATVTVNATNGLAFSSGIGTFNVGALGGASGFNLTDAASVPVTLIVGGNNASSSYAGTFGGSGSLVKAGVGTLSLTGNNSAFSGAMNVSAGTLTAVTSAALPSLQLDFGELRRHADHLRFGHREHWRLDRHVLGGLLGGATFAPGQHRY